MGVGVNVSKGNIYAILGSGGPLNISKANIYAVLSPAILGVGVDVGKAMVYAVVTPKPEQRSFWPIILRMLDQQRQG